MPGPGIGALPARHEVSAMLALFGDDFFVERCDVQSAYRFKLFMDRKVALASIFVMHVLSVYKLETILLAHVWHKSQLEGRTSNSCL